MDSQYIGYSLSALCALRANWLEQGRSDAPRLLQVVRTLGVNTKARPASRAFDPDEYKTLDAGPDAVARFVSQLGSYNPAAKKYNTIARLWIEYKGETVVNLYYANDQIDVMVPDAVYVPGPWIDAILKLEPAAQEKSDALLERNEEIERCELIALLGIGKVI